MSYLVGMTADTCRCTIAEIIMLSSAYLRAPHCRASDTDTTDEILHSALEHARDMRYCQRGDCVVALHRIGNASVIKLVDIK